MILVASESEGWASGTPSITELLPFSAAFCDSQFSNTSALLPTFVPPKTWGCLLINLSATPLATSSILNGASKSSSAILEWK